MDRPHNISIVLSILALAASCLSLWESHNSRVLSRAATRAQLQVTAAVIQPGDNEQQLVLNLTIMNFGKSNAKNVVILPEITTENLSPPKLPIIPGQHRDGIIVTAPAYSHNIPDIPPGRPYVLNLPFPASYSSGANRG